MLISNILMYFLPLFVKWLQFLVGFDLTTAGFTASCLQHVTMDWATEDHGHELLFIYLYLNLQLFF